jgi:arylsulfatase A-like enzyme
MWEKKAGDVPFRNRSGKVKFFTNATIVTNQALKWLQENKKSKKPFFLWLHYMDPHGPYIPPLLYNIYFQNAYKSEPIPPKKLPKYQLQTNPETGRSIIDIGFYRAQYDREIRYLDDELGRLLKETHKLNANRNTVIIFTADHGESFGEHNYYLDHGHFSYQACAHVPLIIIKDGILPKGKTIDKPVGLIDVSATILELAGIDVPPTFEGQSLVDLMLGGKNTTPPE